MSDIFVNLVEELEKLWATQGSFEGIETLPAYLSYVQSEKFLDELRMFRDDKTGETDLTTASPGLRIRVLDFAKGWNINLALFEYPAEAIVAFPNPMAFTLISEDSKCVINQYRISTSLFDHPRIVEPEPLEFLQQHSLKQGDFFCPKVGETVIESVSHNPNTMFLRIYGPNEGPFVHSFETGSLRYLSSTYSSRLSLSDVFYADFLKTLVKSPSIAQFGQSELDRISQFIAEKARSKNSVPHEIWSLIQTASELDTDLTQELLEHFAKSDHYLSPQAQNILGQRA